MPDSGIGNAQKCRKVSPNRSPTQNRQNLMVFDLRSWALLGSGGLWGAGGKEGVVWGGFGETLGGFGETLGKLWDTKTARNARLWGTKTAQNASKRRKAGVFETEKVVDIGSESVHPPVRLSDRPTVRTTDRPSARATIYTNSRSTALAASY